MPYCVAHRMASSATTVVSADGALLSSEDVDILLRRSDFDAATAALEKAGFIRRHVASIDMFLDGPKAKARDAVHVVFALEKVRSDSLLPSPDITESESTAAFRLLKLQPLVQMKLTAFRDKDRTQLRDLIEVGLLDASWLERLPEPLRPRLRQLLVNPEG